MTQAFFEQFELLKKQYLKSLPKRANEIIDAYNAFAVSKDPKAITEICFLLHKIRGSLATYGFNGAASASLILEQCLQEVASVAQYSNKLMQSCREAMQLFQQEIATLQSATNASLAELKPITPTKPLLAVERVERILLLEDDKSYGKILQQNLEEFGFEVRVITALKAASNALAEFKPDIFITDLTVSDAVAEQVLDFLEQAQLSCPIIVLSNSSHFQYRLRAVRIGISTYQTKPVRIDDLVRYIRKQLLQPPQNYRVLIVDDEPSVLQYYRVLLSANGVEVLGLAEPTAILDKIIEFEPDLVVLDYHLDGYSGAEIAAVIRQFSNYESLPILFLTAAEANEIKSSLIELGSDDVLAKNIPKAELVKQIKSRIERGRMLRTRMSLDSLTGLLNHGYIMEQAERLYQLNRRAKLPSSVVLLDIDMFKRVNDNFGHAVGDRVLRSLAQLLQQRLRTSDLAGRYGGEEFLILLPGTAKAEATKVLNMLLHTFAKIIFLENKQHFNCTFSAGISDIDESPTLKAALELADKRLYQAKAAGRNQIKSD